MLKYSSQEVPLLPRKMVRERGIKRAKLEIRKFFHPNPPLTHQRGEEMLGEKAAE
jgi:hypothetical protein